MPFLFIIVAEILSGRRIFDDIQGWPQIFIYIVRNFTWLNIPLSILEWILKLSMFAIGLYISTVTMNFNVTTFRITGHISNPEYDEDENRDL